MNLGFNTRYHALPLRWRGCRLRRARQGKIALMFRVKSLRSEEEKSPPKAVHEFLFDASCWAPFFEAKSKLIAAEAPFSI